MNKQFVMTILLLYGSYYIKADVQELKSNPQTHFPPLCNKLNNSYLPAIPQKEDGKPDIKEHTKTFINKLNYQHNQPKVIDDPLPVKVDHAKPLNIDFVRNQYRPIFKGALISGLFYDIYDTKERKLFETPVHVSHKTDTHIKTKLKAPQPEIKAESSLESTKVVKKPVAVDVVPINYFADPVTKFKLFNYDDEIELSGSAPEVIYKPGDDITFSTDSTVIDDYEHIFSKEDQQKSKKSGAKNEGITTSSKSTTESPAKKEYGKNKKETARASASTLHTETTDDSYSSEATKHSITHEQSESIDTGHGYIYDKPKIPFTF